MLKQLTNLIQMIDRSDGQTMVEYGLIIAGLALVVVFALTAFGTALSGYFNQLTTGIAGWLP